MSLFSPLLTKPFIVSRFSFRIGKYFVSTINDFDIFLCKLPFFKIPIWMPFLSQRFIGSSDYFLASFFADVEIVIVCSHGFSPPWSCELYHIAVMGKTRDHSSYEHHQRISSAFCSSVISPSSSMKPRFCSIKIWSRILVKRLFMR